MLDIKTRQEQKLDIENTRIDDAILAKDWSTSEFKIKQFVGNSHIHPLHKVEQYMLELKSRQELYDAHTYDAMKFQALIELEQEKKNHTQYEAEKKLCDIEIWDLNRKLAATQSKMKITELDIKKYRKIIQDFNDSDQGKDQNGKLYMDILLDPVEREKIEAQYWEYRLAKQAAMDMIAYGRIGSGNMEAILQLDSDAQNKTIAMAYEVLITNEFRMNAIQDRVQHRLSNGGSVSDIGRLMNMEVSEFILQLETQEKNNVPLIQKR